MFLDIANHVDIIS